MHPFVYGHIRGVDHGYADMLNFILSVFDRYESAVLIHIFDAAGDRAMVAEFEQIRSLFPAGEGEIFKDEDAFDFVFYELAWQIWKAFKEISTENRVGGAAAVDLHEVIPQEDFPTGVDYENADVNTVDCPLKNWRKT